MAAAAKAIQLAPRSERGYLARAIARAKKGLLAEALADCDMAIKLAPKRAVCYFNRGNVRILEQNLDGALEDFTQAIALDPKDLGAWANRGSVLALKRDLKGALRDYSQALKLRPDYLQGYINRASIHGQQGDVPRMASDLAQAQKLAAKLSGPFGQHQRARVARMLLAVRRLRLRGLMKVRDTAALLPYLALRDIAVRRVAYKVLLTLAQVGDRLLVLAGLADSDRFVRTYCVTTLSRLRHPEIVPALLAHLPGDKAQTVRGAIVMALAKLGKPAQVMAPLILQLKLDQSDYVLELLEKSLRQLTGADPGVRLDFNKLAPSREKLVAAWQAWWTAEQARQR